MEQDYTLHKHTIHKGKSAVEGLIVRQGLWKTLTEYKKAREAAKNTRTGYFSHTHLCGQRDGLLKNVMLFAYWASFSWLTHRPCLLWRGVHMIGQDWSHDMPLSVVEHLALLYGDIPTMVWGSIYKPVWAAVFDFDIEYQNRTCWMVTLLCACVVQCTVSAGTPLQTAPSFTSMHNTHFSPLTLAHAHAHTHTHKHTHTRTAPSSLVSQSASLDIPSSSQQLMRLRADTEQLQHHLHGNEAQEMQHAHICESTIYRGICSPLAVKPCSKETFRSEVTSTGVSGCRAGGHWSPRQPLVVNLGKVQIVAIPCVVHFNFTEFTILVYSIH